MVCEHVWGSVEGEPVEGGCRRCGIHWWIEDVVSGVDGPHLVVGGHGPSGEVLTVEERAEIERWVLARVVSGPAPAVVVSEPVGRRYQSTRRVRRHRGVV